jgi:collagen type I alpha
VIAPNAAVPFSDSGVRTSGINHASGSAEIVIASPGDYVVSFSVSGVEPNQFALFLNGVIVPGTAYSSGLGTQQSSGQAIVSIGPNGILTLRSQTSGIILVAADPPVVVNASVLIHKLN